MSCQQSFFLHLPVVLFSQFLIFRLVCRDYMVIELMTTWQSTFPWQLRIHYFSNFRRSQRDLSKEDIFKIEIKKLKIISLQGRICLLFANGLFQYIGPKKRQVCSVVRYYVSRLFRIKFECFWLATLQLPKHPYLLLGWW